MLLVLVLGVVKHNLNLVAHLEFGAELGDFEVVTKPGGNHMMSPESYGSTPGLVNEGLMRSNDKFIFLG
eukprot:SAG22_NODE_15269_length_352_cov_8.494071_2_plen_69_part_00